VTLLGMTGADGVQVDNLSQKLEFQVQELEQQGQAGGSNVEQIVDNMLRSDDKLLSSLQKLGWELELQAPEEQEQVIKLRETCARSVSPVPVPCPHCCQWV
jgi:hypothetical protein